MAAGAFVAVSASFAIVNSLVQASETKAQGREAEKQGIAEARSARIRARDAIDRGFQRQGKVRLRQDQLRGRQLSNLGSQGIDPRSGTAAATIIESRMFGDMDAIETLNNAKLEALGFESDALSSEHAGRVARAVADRKASLTKLGGFLNAGSQAASFFAFKNLSKGNNKFAGKAGRLQAENTLLTDRFARQKLQNVPTGRGNQ